MRSEVGVGALGEARLVTRICPDSADWEKAGTYDWIRCGEVED